MYVAAQRLGDAQTILVAAGKAAPRDGYCNAESVWAVTTSD
jgi:hypothetical protein